MKVTYRAIVPPSLVHRLLWELSEYVEEQAYEYQTHWDEDGTFHGWYEVVGNYTRNIHYLSVSLNEKKGGVLYYEYEGSRYGLLGELSGLLLVDPVPTLVIVPGATLTLNEATKLDSLVWKYLLSGLLSVKLYIEDVGYVTAKVIRYESTTPPSWRLLPWEVILYGETPNPPYYRGYSKRPDPVAKAPITVLKKPFPASVGQILSKYGPDVMKPLPGREELFFKIVSSTYQREEY